jgi:hypothetical protein
VRSHAERGNEKGSRNHVRLLGPGSWDTRRLEPNSGAGPFFFKFPRRKTDTILTVHAHFVRRGGGTPGTSSPCGVAILCGGAKMHPIAAPQRRPG